MLSLFLPYFIGKGLPISNMSAGNFLFAIFRKYMYNSKILFKFKGFD